MEFPKLPKIQNKTQRTAAKLLAGFFGLMLVFTIVSRAAEGMTTAAVQAEKPSSGVITDRVTLTGSIKPMEDLDITLPGNLYVTAAKAEPGQFVEEGDVLLEFDAEDVRDQLRDRENGIAIAKNKLAIAENGGSVDTVTAVKNAETALEQAQVDYNRLADKLKVSKARAQQDYNTARAALSDAQTDYATALIKGREDLVAAARAKADSAQKALDSAEGPQAVAEAQKALDSARSELTAARFTADVSTQQVVISAQNSLDAAKRSLQAAERALEDSNRSADDQLLTASRAVDKAKRDLAQARRDAADKERSAENSALQTLNETITLKADIEAQEKTAALLEEILEMDGKLLAPIEGTVQSIMGTGKTQDRVSAARLARGDAGFYYSARTTAANAASLAVGDTGTLTYKSDGRDQRAQAIITDIGAADDDGSVLVKASLPEGSYPSGVSGELAIARTGDRQSTCVPVSALRSDSDGDYVLTLEEKKTVTGLTYTARRVDVEVVSRDSALASLQGGLDRDALVLTSASKPVAEGDRVRIDN